VILGIDKCTIEVPRLRQQARCLRSITTQQSLILAALRTRHGQGTLRGDRRNLRGSGTCLSYLTLTKPYHLPSRVRIGYLSKHMQSFRPGIAKKHRSGHPSSP
jgi:hypothetical protein